MWRPIVHFVLVPTFYTRPISVTSTSCQISPLPRTQHNTGIGPGPRTRAAMDNPKRHCDDAKCEKSCWQEAFEKLHGEDAESYGQLEEILNVPKQPLSRTDMSNQILQSILASKDRLQDRDLPFPWRHRGESGKAKARKAIDGILKAVTVFRDMGSAVASLDPSHAGVAWAGVNMILQLVLGGAEQNAAALEGIAQISVIITRYARIEDIYVEQRQKGQDTSLKQDFRTQVVNLYTKILVYQIAIISHSKRRSILQYVRALPKLDDWNKLLEDILKSDAECRKVTQIFDSQEQTTQHRELKDILEEQDQQMENVSRQLNQLYEQTQELPDRAGQQRITEILDWVSNAPPNDDHTRVLEHGKLNKEYAESGKWLFRRPEFQSWGNIDDQSLSVLWLRGPVGTGKSSLVCLIIEHFLKQRPALCKEVDKVAYFYCSKKQGTEEESSPKTVLRSLLRQLAWSPRDLSVASIIKERYEQQQQAQGYGGHELLADECIQLMIQLIKSYHHTTIIVDALDECSDFYELLPNLEQIISACQGKVKLLLSSRMNVPVQQTFSESARIEVGLDSKEDIDFFISTEIKRNKGRLTQCKALDLEDQLIKTLSHRAQGMFRWVELQLSTFFSPKSAIKRRDAFTRKLERLIKEVGIPVLGDVYDDIYQMNTPEPEDRMVAERALKWVMCCQTPMSMEMLVEAVSVDSNGDIDEQVDSDYLLDICSNFIIVDHNQRVQFAHLSVREYLTNSEKHGYTRAEAHAQTGKTCLLYLLAAGVQDEAVIETRGELRRYATLWWPAHCSQASADPGKNNPLQDLLDKFLNPVEPSAAFIICLETWLDAMKSFEAYQLELRIHTCLNPAKSPVFTACVWGFSGIVKTALSHGFNLDERNSRGDTALAVAADYMKIDIVKLLLQSGADVNAVGTQGGSTPLHEGYASLELVKLLFHNGADVTKAIEGHINGGWTPLHLAAHHKHEDIVRFLLAKGANVNAKDNESSTTLNIVASTGDTAIAQLLLEHGADAGLKDEKGQTALQKAAIYGREDMVKLILKHQGMETDSEKWLRQAQFYNAVCAGEEGKVQSLLEQGVDITVTGVLGESPIHWATQHGRPQIAHLLVQRGADIDAMDKFGETALWRACRKGDEEMIDLLLNNGADINLEQGLNEKGNKCSPLSLVTCRGMPQMVELLLKRGADPHTVDVQSLEPWHYARLEDFEKALDILRSYLI